MPQLPAVIDPSAALKAYRKDSDWMFKTGIGGTLNAASMLIALAFAQSPWFIPVAMAVSSIVIGYLIRTAKAKVEDPNSALPTWSGPSDLVFGGLTWMAVQFAWSVLAAIPITTAISMGVFGVQAYDKNIPAVTILMATIGFTLLLTSLGLHLLLSYLMINFASEEKLSAAFNLAKFIRYMRMYPKQLLTAWILALQLQIFSILIPCATIVGVLITPTTFFASQLIGISIMCQAWARAVEADKYAKVEKI